MTDMKLTAIYVSVIMITLSMIAAPSLVTLVVCLSTLLWATIRVTTLGVQYYAARIESRRQKRASLIDRAEKQHKAIIDGKYPAGFYGQHKPAVPVFFIDGLDKPKEKPKPTKPRKVPHGYCLTCGRPEHIQVWGHEHKINRVGPKPMEPEPIKIVNGAGQFMWGNHF